ncbi:ImmA/IrrE family metallo-endopeptidase [Mariniradius sediminis]|uniref:Cyclodeaminase/cyclohydrolase family protein n=1 Tax=Mariniradius sediminis TaxID=2909237 RepID=A0ABS9BYP6_9BACT|nr:ImmA/IrrE family metallo-endopeptidase [Mariniradius sediminis]MCF1753176.1 cyclodeaminase/cyclohydrolase family protein [Mariniradius sediminis]
MEIFLVVFLGKFKPIYLVTSMDIVFSKITVAELLEKIGAGKHIPGSGSSAALQVVVNAQLLLTVIKITLKPNKKEKYGHEWAQMQILKEKIENVYIPRLNQLFHDDYIVFDEVITTRKLRDDLKSEIEEGIPNKFLKVKSKLDQDHLLATKIVLEIAKLSHEIAREGLYVFLNGFKGARGDSALAVQNSLSVVMGSLHIAELNLRQLIEHEELDDLELEIDKIRSDYFKTYAEAQTKIKILQKQIEKAKRSHAKIGGVLSKINVSEIEKSVRTFQRELYNVSTTKDLDSVTNSELAFNFLGYDIKKVPSLGTFNDFDGRKETAGAIDNVKKIVRVATKFSPPVQRYTMAHELGHAILHHKSLRVFHRDRELDFRIDNPKRDPIEVQADKFAAFFLMPRKEMKAQFLARFQSEKLKIDEDVAFHLGISLSDLKKKHKEKRHLSRFIASTPIYAGKSFETLANQFKVSVEAMAIQIEELELIDFKSVGY